MWSENSPRSAWNQLPPHPTTPVRSIHARHLADHKTVALLRTVLSLADLLVYIAAVLMAGTRQSPKGSAPDPAEEAYRAP